MEYRYESSFEFFPKSNPYPYQNGRIHQICNSVTLKNAKFCYKKIQICVSELADSKLLKTIWVKSLKWSKKYTKIVD
jgi:hypothetical protein